MCHNYMKGLLCVTLPLDIVHKLFILSPENIKALPNKNHQLNLDTFKKKKKVLRRKKSKKGDYSMKNTNQNP